MLNDYTGEGHAIGAGDDATNVAPPGHHYRNPALCRVLGALPSAFYRALDKEPDFGSALDGSKCMSKPSNRSDPALRVQPGVAPQQGERRDVLVETSACQALATA